MTDDQLLELAKQLIAIKSTADNPAGLQEAYDCMVEMLLASGKDITIEQFESGGKPSFLAYKGAERPGNFRIILNGHLDVVPGKPEQYQPVVKEGKLYGRGTYDMKAACVVLADIFCDFVDKVPFALGLQIVTDEESAGEHGTLHQINNGVRGDFVICGESGRSASVHEIANEAKGVAMVEVGFKGNSAHGAYPWQGDNAALKAVKFAHALHERFPSPTQESSGTTITITSVSSVSKAHNIIPDNATVKLDARFVFDDPHFMSKRHFEALIKELDPSAEILGYHCFSAPLYTSPENPLLQSLKASAEKIENAEFSVVRRNGSNDGRFYGDVGNQACEFGVAGEGQHGDDEHITLQAFKNYRATLRDFLTKQALAEKIAEIPAQLTVDV